MQKRKARAFNEHREIIEWMFYIGKGIMFRKHLLKFFTIHGYQKRKVEESIRDLIDSELIESFRYGNSHVLKLKKYGVYTIQGKESKEVDSIRISNKKLLRSAFLNQKLLNFLTDQAPSFLAKGIGFTLRYIQHFHSHVSFEKHSYEILLRLLDLDRKNEARGISEKILANRVEHEINNLRIIREYTENRKWKKEAEKLRIQRETNPIYAINLNGLHSRDIYFYYYRSVYKGSSRNFIDIDFFDIQSTMTEKQLETKLKLAIPYLKSLLDSEVKIRVNILVASSIRREYFLSRMKRIKKNFNQATNISGIGISVINLDLEETLFAGMTIIN